MDNNINIRDFEEAVITTAKDRYEFSLESDAITQLISIATEKIIEKTVIQLKRNVNSSNNWRTIIIGFIDKINDYPHILKWAGDVRDELLDPEISDLYSITVIIGEEVSIDKCTNIESSDKFCRKYLLRPGETVEGLLNRTFLTALTSETSEEDIADPLHSALTNTEKSLPWFNSSMQTLWRTALLSENTSADLIENLFTDNITFQKNHEASTEDNNQ